MIRFFKDLFTYPFQKDKTNNRANQLFTLLFKDFPALFWIKPTFKKLLIPFFIIRHYVFTT
ncbi:MAG: hypothetical protein LBD11_02240 [Candidatus Peribacteria bacterium]|jgi:hypothetical protein|nr:hypothetical protein [Candidatus Peribacteria bacterium]